MCLCSRVVAPVANTRNYKHNYKFNALGNNNRKNRLVQPQFAKMF